MKIKEFLGSTVLDKNANEDSKILKFVRDYCF